MSGQRDEGGTSAMESLYPFLYAGTTDLAAVLEQVRASTVEKTGEILGLRRAIARPKRGETWAAV